MTERHPDRTDVLFGHLLTGTTVGYTVGDVYVAEHIADPLTNLQCAKMWLEDHPLFHKDTNAPVT